MTQTVDHGVENAIVNLSGYRFVALEHLPVLQADLDAALRATGILGTILLADEGINVALAGTAEQAAAARAVFDAEPALRQLWLKESYSREVPFSKLKVRIRHEIIAFDGAGAKLRQFDRPEAPSLPPETVRDWLDAGRNVVLLDTRNDYEIEAGTFRNAIDLGISHFRDFQAAVRHAVETGELDHDTPIITFCTGGVRCEKAAPWMLEEGFREVYQIEGGIINYFEHCHGAHWQGDCFVFDDRVEIDTTLAPTGTRWCNPCQRRVAETESCDCDTTDALVGSH